MMQQKLMRIFVAGALALIVADCSSPNDDALSDDTSSADDAPEFFDGPTTDVPTISSRYFTGGSARISVKGSFQIDADEPLNTAASFGDGEMTWIQFGASGSEEPNATVTFSDIEIGINVAKGRNVATAEASLCSGGSEVSATTVSGHYSCKDIDSYDPDTGNMGKVDIEIDFTSSS
jgi:hypothetical protein